MCATFAQLLVQLLVRRHRRIVVGNALRHNPFAPFVPCHRIVSSDLRLGGFCGEWGTEGQEGSKCSKKVQMLAQEGVFFSGKGVLEDKKTMLWDVKNL